MRYFRNIGTALTETLGAFSGITINSNETTSGAAFRRQIPWLIKFIDSLFFWQENHCEYSQRREIEDCKELLLAIGFTVEPPEVTLKEAVVIQAALSKGDPAPAPSKLWVAQAPARAEEFTADDPMSDDFDAEGWFVGLPENAKNRIVEWGVSIKMSLANRRRVGTIARNWHGAKAVSRANHGMTQ